MRDDEVNRWRVVLRVPWVARREPEAQNSDRTNVHGPLPYPRPAPQLDRATARLARDLLERRGEQLAAEHDRSSVHEHVPHVARLRGVDDVRDGIAPVRGKMRRPRSSTTRSARLPTA